MKMRCWTEFEILEVSTLHVLSFLYKLQPFITLEDCHNIRATILHIKFNPFEHNMFFKNYLLSVTHGNTPKIEEVLLSKRNDISCSETECIASKGKGKGKDKTC